MSHSPYLLCIPSVFNILSVLICTLPAYIDIILTLWTCIQSRVASLTFWTNTLLNSTYGSINICHLNISMDLICVCFDPTFHLMKSWGLHFHFALSALLCLFSLNWNSVTSPTTREKEFFLMCLLLMFNPLFLGLSQKDVLKCICSVPILSHECTSYTASLAEEGRI